jgi:Rieske Fe-S protein
MNTPKLSGTRRDAVVAFSFVGIGGLAALWPLVDQMNPNGSSARDSLEVDLGAFGAASLKLVRWKGEPYLIRRRTSEEIGIARGVSLTSLTDQVARVAGLGEKDLATDDNRTKAGHREWLVVAGACTRCACLLKDGRRCRRCLLLPVLCLPFRSGRAGERRASALEPSRAPVSVQRARSPGNRPFSRWPGCAFDRAHGR